MKIKTLLSVVIGMMITLVSFSQTVVIVEPDAGINIGALNDAITANPGDVIFELKRDGIYYINGLISTSAPLHIRAQAGTGKMPILQPAADNIGESSNIFSLGGNTKLEGLYLSGLDDLGNLKKNTIRVGTPDVRIEITGCMFDYDAQCPIRLNVSGTKVYVKDCIFRNIINVNEPNDGKLVDTRGNKTDSIVFENNTVMHIGDLVARISGAFVKYFKFDHNTFYLIGDGFDLSIMKEVEITNNICYNMNWQGGDTTGASLPNSFIKMDSLINLDGITDADRTFKITNNNIFTEQKYFDALAYGIFVKPIFNDEACNYFIQSGQMDTSKNLSEALNFSNPPAAPMDYVIAWHEHHGILEGVAVPNFYADLEVNVPGGEDEFTFNYAATSKSAKASTTRGQLGSTRWSLITGINDFSESKSAFTFYPNPSQSTICLKFEFEDPSTIHLTINDVTGKQVKDLIYNNISKSNDIHLDITDLTMGSYLINFSTENGLRGGSKLMIVK